MASQCGSLEPRGAWLHCMVFMELWKKRNRALYQLSSWSATSIGFPRGLHHVKDPFDPVRIKCAHGFRMTWPRAKESSQLLAMGFGL